MGADKPSPDYGRHFGTLAGRYDQLRKDPSDAQIGVSVQAGELRRRRLLDVGCGTGRIAAVLAAEYGVRVWGIDPSRQMLAVARARAASVHLACAVAEHVPFAAGAFECALMQIVVHLVDRPRAFGELYRVLAPGGRVVIATVDPAGVERIWLSRLFPSYAEIDRRRFPASALLETELADAGFAATRCVPFVEQVVYSRAEALHLLRQRYASSFALIGDTEYEAGIERAERELQEHVAFPLALAIVVAER